MTEWVDVRNFDALMNDYQKSNNDGTMMPGLATYFEILIQQNKEIINLLKELLDEEKKCIFKSVGF